MGNILNKLIIKYLTAGRGWMEVVEGGWRWLKVDVEYETNKLVNVTCS